MNILKSDNRLIDIENLLDNEPVSALQKIVVLFAALVVIMDGFNNQLIGYAIPVLMKQWGKSKGSFAPAVAGGLIGMVIGSTCAGLIADRFGRRRALIGCALLFGVATFAVGYATDISALAALRFVAGLGIGGAFPIATTITAEFTPARRRTMAVTATIVCVPGGGMLAGFFAAQILPRLGWPALFFIGGLSPVLFAGVLFLFLPETPRYLVQYKNRWTELETLLGRLSYPVGPATEFMDHVGQSAAKPAGFATLFSGNLVRDTASLWAACFMCLLVVYSAFSWLPTALVSEGLSTANASYGLAAWNMGGVIGALICAVTVTRFGSRWPLALCCLGAATSSYLLQHANPHGRTEVMIYGLGIHGLFVNAVQSLLFALCAFVYPTSIRATGTASMLAFGRVGAIVSGFWGVSLIIRGGAQMYLMMMSWAMLLVLAALLVGKRQIPPYSLTGPRGE